MHALEIVSDSKKSLNERFEKVIDAVNFQNLKCEFFGVFCLVYFGGLSYVHSSVNTTGTDLYTYYEVGLLNTLLYSLLIAIGHYHSGGIYNPVLVVSLMSIKKLEVNKGISYICTHLLASAIAGATLELTLPENMMLSFSKFEIFIGYPSIRSWNDGISCLIAEIIGTTMVVLMNSFVVYCTEGILIQGLIVGCTYGSMSLLKIGSFTGASCNFARVLGPAIVNNNLFALLWFIFGQGIGAAIGTVLSEYLLTQRTHHEKYNKVDGLQKADFSYHDKIFMRKKTEENLMGGLVYEEIESDNKESLLPENPQGNTSSDEDFGDSK